MAHKAFTLLELLMALAIIALLTALLFPVLAAARRKAHEVPCASNLHQLHVAWTMYIDDSAGTYGSVQQGWVGYRCFRISRGDYAIFRPQWQFVSDEPCPTDLLGPLRLCRGRGSSLPLW